MKTICLSFCVFFSRTFQLKQKGWKGGGANQYFWRPTNYSLEISELN